MHHRLLAAALGSLATLCAPAWAFNPQPDPPARFAMVGITPDQIARLNVVARASALPDARLGPCRLNLSFTDAEGLPLMNATSMVLRPGKAAHVDLSLARTADVVSAGIAARVQFLPAVQVSANVAGEGMCPGVAASLEVIDANGHTAVYIDDPNLYLPH